MPIISIDATLFWQIINFFILVLIFRRYFKKPLSKIINKREKIIKTNLENAKNANEEAINFNKKASEELGRARIDAVHIMQKAKTRANEEEDKILKEAKNNGHKIVKRAEEEAMRIRKEAQENIIQQARLLSMEFAEKILLEKIDNKIETALIDEFIKKVGEE